MRFLGRPTSIVARHGRYLIAGCLLAGAVLAFAVCGSSKKSSSGAGVPQVSPANTYVGLTTNDPGSAPGEPQIYYRTGKRTYLRIVPRDSIQAKAGDIAMKQGGCSRVAVANDKTAYGAGLATQVK